MVTPLDVESSIVRTNGLTCSGTSVGSGVALAVLVVNGMRVVIVNSRDSTR